jgi:hypothetical protein
MRVFEIKKAVATISLIVAITLAGFALGLAHDSALASSSYSLGLQHGFPASAAAPDDFRFELLLLGSGQPATPVLDGAWETSRFPASAAPAHRSLPSATPRTRKVPLHLLDSRLLI